MAHVGANQGKLSERERYCRSGEEAVVYYHRKSVLEALGGGRETGQCLDVICGKRLDRRAYISGY